MFDIIKDYLISVGMAVDKQAFKDAENQMNTAEKKINSFGGKTGSTFLKVGATAGALAVAVGTAMAKFSLSVAEADRQVGFLANRLYTTKENARALTTAMKAMNFKSIEDLRNLGLDPEARAQFLELKQLARSLENPRTKQAMKEIRQINFEIQKLMVRFEYFKMEIAAKTLEIFKQLKPTIQSIIDWFKPIVNSVRELWGSFQGAMPNIKRGISSIWEMLKPIFNAFRATVILAVKGFKFIFDGIKNLPEGFRVAFATVKHILDPIVRIFEFIEDLIVYLAGGDSKFELMYDKLKWLRDIRNETAGDNEHRDAQEVDRRNRIASKRAASDVAYKNQMNAGRAGYYGAIRYYKSGQSVHGFGVNSVRGKSGVSDANMLMLAELNSLLRGNTQGLRISAGTEGAHSKNSKHYGGGALDIETIGSTPLKQIVKLVMATQQANTVNKALIEYSQADYARLQEAAVQLGYDRNALDKYLLRDKQGRVQWAKAGNSHLHLEPNSVEKSLEQTDLQQSRQIAQTYNINIQGGTNITENEKEEIRQTILWASGGLQ